MTHHTIQVHNRDSREAEAKANLPDARDRFITGVPSPLDSTMDVEIFLDVYTDQFWAVVGPEPICVTLTDPYLAGIKKKIRDFQFKAMGVITEFTYKYEAQEDGGFELVVRVRPLNVYLTDKGHLHHDPTTGELRPVTPPGALPNADGSRTVWIHGEIWSLDALADKVSELDQFVQDREFFAGMGPSSCDPEEEPGCSGYAMGCGCAACITAGAF